MECLEIDARDATLLWIQTSESDTDMNRYKPAQSVRFTATLSVNSVLTDAAGLSLTLHPPTGASGSPIIDSSPVRDSQGMYHSDQVIPLAAAAGLWTARWQAPGPTPTDAALVEAHFRVLSLDF
jgi:hypothetical protein